MKIQNNPQISPNFGMAMILEKGSRKAIEEGGMVLVERLKKAGEIVKDTKIAHLHIGEGAIPTVKTPFANKYSEYFYAQEPDKFTPEFLHVKTIWTGTELSESLKPGKEYTACIKMENAEAAKKAYNEIKNARSEIERGAILTRILDNTYEQEALADAKKIEEKAQIRQEVNNLFEQFGEKQD